MNRMQYNFDEIIDRARTDSVKLEKLKSLFGQDDLIPLWVADTDFKSPPAIIEALQRRVEHGIFGYTVPPENYLHAIMGWLQRRHAWEVKKSYSFVTRRGERNRFCH